MIGAEPVSEEGSPRLAVRTVAWMLHAELGGMGGILRRRGEACAECKQRQSKQARIAAG